MTDPLASIAAQNRRLQAVFNAVEQACHTKGWVTLGSIPRGGDVPEEDAALREALDYLDRPGLLETHEHGGKRFWRVRR